jgi:hypothetical protein
MFSMISRWIEIPAHMIDCPNATSQSHVAGVIKTAPERTGELKSAAASLQNKLAGVEGGLLQFKSRSEGDPIRFCGAAR